MAILTTFVNSATVYALTGLKPCVSQPSRGPHLLDQIYVNSELVKKASLQPPLGRSDHKAVLWVPNPLPTLTVTKKLVRVHAKSNTAAFMQAAASIDWMAFANDPDSVDDCAHCFQTTVLKLLDIYFPLRVFRVRSTDPIWMKPSFKVLLNKRDKA